MFNVYHGKHITRCIHKDYLDDYKNRINSKEEGTKLIGEATEEQVLHKTGVMNSGFKREDQWENN